MRFLLGVLVGYSMRGKKKLLMTILATGAFTIYIIVPAIMLLALGLDVKKERQSRPAQTRVPAIKGLSYQDAKAKLHASNLNIRLLATRRNLPLPPGLVIDQNPQPGEEVVYGYPVGVTITEADRCVAVSISETMHSIKIMSAICTSRLRLRTEEVATGLERSIEPSNLVIL
ncbi:MAG: PASTA domain-containing protein [bacterium]